MNLKIIDDISNFIFFEDKLELVDAILIPGGNYPELPQRAADLWKQGYAPYVVPSGRYSIKYGRFLGVKSQMETFQEDYETECDFFTDVLVRSGVDKKWILQEKEAQCTADNARYTKKLLEEKKIELKKAIICCKGFHARRCLMFYQFYFPDTEFFVAPVYEPERNHITKDNWYLTEEGLTKVLGELTRVGTQFMPEFEQLRMQMQDVTTG